MRRVDDTVLSGCPLDPALPAIPSSSLRLRDLTNNVISPWQLCTSKLELTFKINDQNKCYLIYMAKWRNSVVWAIRIDLLTFGSLPTKHLSSLREIPQGVTNNPAQCICPHSPVANCWLPSLSKTPSHIYGSQLTHLLRCVRGFPRVFQSHKGAWGLSLSSGASPPNVAKTTIKNLAEEVSEQKGALMICFGSKSFYNFILPSQWPKWRWTQKGTLGNSRGENSLQERSPCAQVLVSTGDRFGLSGTQRVTEYLRSWEITETTLGRNCGPITQKL